MPVHTSIYLSCAHPPTYVKTNPKKQTRPHQQTKKGTGSTRISHVCTHPKLPPPPHPKKTGTDTGSTPRDKRRVEDEAEGEKAEEEEEEEEEEGRFRLEVTFPTWGGVGKAHAKRRRAAARCVVLSGWVVAWFDFVWVVGRVVRFRWVYWLVEEIEMVCVFMYCSKPIQLAPTPQPTPTPKLVLITHHPQPQQRILYQDGAAGGRHQSPRQFRLVPPNGGGSSLNSRRISSSINGHRRRSDSSSSHRRSTSSSINRHRRRSDSYTSSDSRSSTTRTAAAGGGTGAGARGMAPRIPRPHRVAGGAGGAAPAVGVGAAREAGVLSRGDLTDLGGGGGYGGRGVFVCVWNYLSLRPWQR